jgi:hypothetical protein
MTGPSRESWPIDSHRAPYLYRAHNAVERLFERLKDFRWVAIRFPRRGLSRRDPLLLRAMGLDLFPEGSLVLHLNDEQNKII